MSTGTDYLDSIAESLKEGRRQWRRGDNLLSAFGYVRRRQTAIDQIRNELAKRGLRTDPEITTSMPLDGYVTFYRKDDAGLVSSATEPTVEQQREADLEAAQDPAALKVADVALTVANLEASERTPMAVGPNATVSEAITKMELNKYSQLVVQTGPKAVKGTVSFKSIARAQLVGKPSHVHECLDEPVPRVRLDTPLLEVVAQFRSHDAVLVFGADTAISGIVTPADIAGEFGGLAEPFFLVADIENLLRWLLVRSGVDLATTLEEIGAREPGAGALPPEDLSLGDIERLLQHGETWDSLKVPYDRKTVCEELDEVRRVRNSVMHFREPLSEEQLSKLRSFQSLLKRMCEAVA